MFLQHVILIVRSVIQVVLVNVTQANATQDTLTFHLVKLAVVSVAEKFCSLFFINKQHFYKFFLDSFQNMLRKETL